jgi:valyl-tRNA synthetase
MIDKTYQPSEVEGRIYQTWEKAGAFRAGRPERAGAPAYSIVIPPPNVTGSLHMGHALNNTLQDILARFERMRGKDVLWQPGTDHAGIATQMVVERQLMERQQPGRREMGREAFLKRVWEWKAESGGTIINQLKRLGASCDWSRERFTMDEGLSKAVIKVFVQLYNEKLIYKDKRLVNWDPKLLTAISDLEVVQVESKGNMWHFRYPLAEDPSKYICIATTRPETMLGDGAVAVHPDDERYKHLVGKLVRLPLADRLIPVITDEYPEPEKGSGAVKITAAHDFNDFEVWLRHRDEDYFKKQKNGGLINLFTPEAKMNENCPPQYQGLDRFEARKRIIADIEALGLLDQIEKVTHAVPHGDRSNVVIEPYLTEQWYVNAAELAKPAIAAVREGKTNFVPKNWETTYFNWMENIQPWCISRQLWWGHQIPAWYHLKINEKDEVSLDLTSINAPFRGEPADLSQYAYVVEESENAALEKVKKKYPRHEVRIVENERAALALLNEKKIGVWRDEDVLDTWFSSALWPFSTMGWPDDTKELKRFYPTSALVTGFDIIFFWVARMMMMGLHFMKDAKGSPEIPFHDVYIHRLVRDASGAKMSKSKGNVVDPLGVIDEFGADALRFTLARNVAPGHDIRLGPQDVENNRNFATKLWNAARFGEMNGCELVADFNPTAAKVTINLWIAHEASAAAQDITAALVDFKFNEAAAIAYRFVWNIYCDWYLELAKPILLGPDGDAKRETQAMVAWVRDEIIKLLHPFMPFVTEELWAVTGGSGRGGLLALTEWPSGHGHWKPEAEAEVGWVIDVITAIRSLRAEMNVNVPLPLILAGASDQVWARAQRWSDFLERMARISEVRRMPSYPTGTIQLVVRSDTIGLAVAGLIDIPAERARLAKEMQKAESDIARVDAKLGNAKFVANAPEDIIEGEKEKRAEAVERKAKIAEALERLKGSVS